MKNIEKINVIELSKESLLQINGGQEPGSYDLGYTVGSYYRKFYSFLGSIRFKWIGVAI